MSDDVPEWVAPEAKRILRDVKPTFDQRDINVVEWSLNEAHTIGWNAGADERDQLREALRQSCEELAVTRDALRELRIRGFLECAAKPPCGSCAVCEARALLAR